MYVLLQPGVPTDRIRDVFIIVVAFETLVIGIALIVLLVQVASLINLLQNEVRPIIKATNDTVNNLRGTAEFLGENVVEPVIKPRHMTLEELGRELGKASQKFYLHKFQNLDNLSPWKREFMLAVFDILVNNSYLAGQMRAMVRDGKEMPAEVKALIRSVKGHQGHGGHPIAPIP